MLSEGVLRWFGSGHIIQQLGRRDLNLALEFCRCSAREVAVKVEQSLSHGVFAASCITRWAGIVRISSTSFVLIRNLHARAGQGRGNHARIHADQQRR